MIKEIMKIKVSRGTSNVILSLALIVGYFTTLYLANQRHLNRVEPYLISSGKVYSWKSYKCVGGVMYSSGRSDTLLVEKDGNPKQCTIIRISNREFSEL
ncbi:hypothetical protein VPHF99_0008 [Vibrio phage F99]